MAYRLRYTVNVDWVPPGIGPSGNPVQGPNGGGGPAQTIAFFPQSGGNPIAGQYTSTFLTADVTTLTNAMAADISTQLNIAATLARIQAFSTGGT